MEIIRSGKISGRDILKDKRSIENDSGFKMIELEIFTVLPIYVRYKYEDWMKLTSEMAEVDL